MGIKELKRYLIDDSNDPVEPEIGSILKVDLVPESVPDSLKESLGGVFADHTGIYIGDGKIVELYNHFGTAEIKIVTPKRFLHGARGEYVRTGHEIYCASSGGALGSPEIAERAINAVGCSHDYDLMGKNCHVFVTYCITGEEITEESIHKDIRWLLGGVVRSLKKYFGDYSYYWSPVKNKGYFKALGRKRYDDK